MRLRMRKKLKEVELFIDVAKQVQQLGDEWEKHVRGQIEPPSCDSCEVPGCCYQAVTATPAEGIVIATHLASIGVDTRDYRERLRIVGEKSESMTREEWFEHAVPCVFLGDDFRCRIYPWRPANCRTYIVTSDPVHCLPQLVRTDEQTESKNTTVINNAQVIGTSLILSQGLIAATGERINRPFIRMLPVMVSVMLRAIQATDSDIFWKIVLKEAQMTEPVFQRMLAENEAL